VLGACARPLLPGVYVAVAPLGCKLGSPPNLPLLGVVLPLNTGGYHKLVIEHLHTLISINV